ncbi:MAG: cupin domain-containing protein [Pyrinomonadaceae bacterium]|nr:cupin domain-containing protein [Pyrinomonadaceae bacterium]
MNKMDLNDIAKRLPVAWKSTIVWHAAYANFKVLRMDASAYPPEVHDYAEALPVLNGCMNLEVSGEIITVLAGEVYIVPAGLQHSVAPGSHGTLVVVEP